MNQKNGIEAMFFKQKISLSQQPSSLEKRKYDSACSPNESHSLNLKHNSSPDKCFESDHNDEPEIVSSQYLPINVSLIIGKTQASPSKSSKMDRKPKVRVLFFFKLIQDGYKLVNRVRLRSGTQR